MIKIVYSATRPRLSSFEFSRKIGLLPESASCEVSRYIRWEDRQAALFGRLLIEREMGPGALVSMRRSLHGRPSIMGAPDFNLSHTDGLVALAVSPWARVGLDVERVRPIDCKDFLGYFSSSELDNLGTSEGSPEILLSWWTQKECAAKADGRGLSINLRDIILRQGYAVIDGRRWFIRPVNLGDDYVCHLASDNLDSIQTVSCSYFSEYTAGPDANTSSNPTTGVKSIDAKK